MEEAQAEAAPAPVPEGSVTWRNPQPRIQEGSFSARSLLENISSIGAIDYDQMQQTLRQQLNDMATTVRCV